MSKRAKKVWMVIGIIFLSICIVGAVTALIGFGLGWYDKFEDEITEDSEDAEEEDLSIVLSSYRIDPEEYEDYGVSTLATKAYTVTATLTGDVYDSRVDWELKWTDGGSHGNISNYVTLSYSSPYDRQCVIESIAPFSYQISLVAYRTGYPEQTATCVLDYMPTFETGSFVLVNDNDNFGLYCANYSLSTGTIVPVLSCSLNSPICLAYYDQSFSTACSNLASILSSCFSTLGLSSYATTLVDDFFSLFVLEDGGVSVSFNRGINPNSYTLSSLYEACCNNLFNSSDWNNISATSNILYNDVYSAFGNAFSLVSWYCSVTVTLTYQDVTQVYTGYFVMMFDRFSFAYSDNANLSISDGGLVFTN